MLQTSLFTTPPTNILPFDGEAYCYEHFFDAAIAAQLFAQLQEEVAWKQEPIVLFGKQVMQPRLTALYGDPNKTYCYSGITMQPHAWTNALLFIKQQVEGIAQQNFTTALLNYYRNGQDSMGWHRDNEPSLGKQPCIASVSLGATRKFGFKHHADKKTGISIPLTNGSLLLMKGLTQQCWLHAIPKTMLPVGERINITFRTIVTE